jgi:hypothetical protein
MRYPSPCPGAGEVIVFYQEWIAMRKLLWRVTVGHALLAVVLATSACNKVKNNDPGAGGPGPNMGGGPWPGMGGPGGPPTPTGEIMNKLGKGPTSLTTTIGNELKTDPPPWDTIQPQAKEYAQLAGSVGKYDPPKGDKESWKKLTAAFAESATALDRAAAAKDKEAAVAAHKTLTQSCMACHREHRAGPGGMGRPGGFGPPGGPPGGAPNGPAPAPQK